ncbi:MAG: helix-turn-helix domain-containing protein [Lachnospiraceae bacterium]|nr:helix-turn-helix domain-containing protein [Lachnospiraceae bacterium]
MIQGLGERLKLQREKLHMSQKEVANAINVSPAVISNYEASERSPSIEKLLALASLYRCSTDYLLGIEKPNKTIDASMLSDKQLNALQEFINDIKK